MKKVAKIGINGFGRIGKQLVRIASKLDDIEVVGINDPFMDIEYAKYLLEHETAILAKTDVGLFVLDKKGNKLTLPKDNFYVIEQLSLFD